MLNNNAQVVEWDDSKLKEIEEAKVKYQQARREHRRITTLEGTPVEGFRANLLAFRILQPELSETQFTVRLINDTGDELLIWDSIVKSEVAEAGKVFTEYLEKGWKAYAVTPDGKLGQRIVKFDAALEEVHFADKKTLKLDAFVKSFKQVQVLPKTRKA